MPLLRLALLLMLGLLLACSDGGQQEYATAMAELERLELEVDAGFDAARNRMGELVAEGAWTDPAALEARLTDSRQTMAQVVAQQTSRIVQERAMLALEAMDNAPKTRELYHLDLAAQEGKLGVFVAYYDMCGALLAALQADQPVSYMEQARDYRDRIATANAVFKDLDAARQLRQEALFVIAPQRG